MPHDPAEKKPQGPLRVLSNWLRRGPPDPDSVSSLADMSAREGRPVRIGHYVITGKLGQGGMGTVYAARDERLERVVAIKVMSQFSGDEMARKRFWREARAAASVNHPNICQLYEIGEHSGEPFIAMELLEGEPLAERLRHGALSVSETLPIGLGMLDALAALHSRGIIHRDLKPSNVFLTPHGVKLLDFGLARMSDRDLTASPSWFADLTRTGMVVGTPRYMSPEQVVGDAMDARSDLFAVGAILFEMLAGRPAFGGRNAVEVLHATVHEQPPALTGSPTVAAVDRVIRRALAKRAPERPASANAMAEELRAVNGAFDDDTPALARALTRLIVLPFRVLRPDPETGFLAFSLPDAIATSLSRFGSLIVRSSAAVVRSGGEVPDLKALAVDADVERVVMGTLLRSGDELQVTAQLVEAPSGTLVTSHTVLSSLGNLFRLQDDIVRGIVEALSLSLTGAGAPATLDVPKEAQAYELYLRANALARSYDQLPAARDLYQQCLELDSSFAPAWARLGRCHWVISKYIEPSNDARTRAEGAFRRALELNPRLSIAHKLYANFESDTGNSRNALVRLLGEIRVRGNDPELFAGLVHACRFAGLYEQSIAAHHEARRLDPNTPTSVAQTILMTTYHESLLVMEPPLAVTGDDEVILVIALGLAGRRDEARSKLLDLRQETRIRAFLAWSDLLLAWLDRRPADMLASGQILGAFEIIDDPEAAFQQAWLFCDVGEHKLGLDFLQRAIAGGYYATPTLEAGRQFDALRSYPAFKELLAESAAGRAQALTAFCESGGERLLGH